MQDILNNVFSNQMFQGGMAIGIFAAVFRFIVPLYKSITNFFKRIGSISRKYRQSSHNFDKVCLYFEKTFENRNFGSYVIIDIRCVPVGIRLIFKYNSLIIFNLSERQLENAESNRSIEYTIDIAVYTIFNKKKIIKKIEKEIEELWERENENKRHIWSYSRTYASYERCGELPKKSFNTIFSNELDDFAKDVKNFLSPKTREFYELRGIPYRRGYLLTGPPGTGKTSATIAICNMLNTELYNINLSNIDDKGIIKALSKLSNVNDDDRKIILIEDVDAFSDACKSRKSNVNSSDNTGKSGPCLTLGGLLMAIDGPFTNEGHVLIMTSNNPVDLDPALIRPGRIDKIFNIGYMESNKGLEMVKHLYNSPINGHTENIKNIFENKKITPATVQSTFLCNTDNIDNFIKELHNKGERHLNNVDVEI